MVVEIDNKKSTRISGDLTYSVIAPCRPEGEVVTIDDDTKDGLCRCPLNPKGCLVDSGNRILN